MQQWWSTKNTNRTMTDRSQFKLAIMVLKFVEMDVGSSIATCSLNFWESYLRRKDRDHKFAALVLYCCFQVRWCGRRGNRIKGGFTTGITSVDSASHPSPSGCETQHKRESGRDGEQHFPHSKRAADKSVQQLQNQQSFIVHHPHQTSEG